MKLSWRRIARKIQFKIFGFSLTRDRREGSALASPQRFEP
jgi:hypothetical protein